MRTIDAIAEILKSNRARTQGHGRRQSCPAGIVTAEEHTVSHLHEL